MLIHDGYMYVYKQPLADNKHSWECRFRRKKLCKALVTVLDDNIVNTVNEHTHAPNAAEIEVTKIRASIKRKAQTTQDTPQQILTVELGNVSVPRMEHIRRAIRIQRENNDAPVIPQTRQNIPAIPQEYCVTTLGDRFLLNDSGPGDPNRLIIFATDDGLDVLRTSDHWFADGTFEVSPAVFFQVYPII